MLPRGMARWIVLVALGGPAACASGPDQGAAAAAAPTGSATSGPAPATPQQVFGTGQTVQSVTPSQTRMLGPAANGPAALSLVPGF